MEHVTHGITLDGVARFVDIATDALSSAREEIDALNVYPVPDGDTGTNMFLTVSAARDALREARAGDPDLSLGDGMAVLARAALMGARGNSGVILSQMLRAYVRHLAGAAIEDSPAATIAAAMAEATDASYAAVGTPVEGTILTVSRAASDAALEAAARGARTRDVFTAAAAAARVALARTPEQLEVLAQAGVVDAGGRGLCVVLDAVETTATGRRPMPMALPIGTHHIPVAATVPTDDLTEDGPGYEVMYLLDVAPEAEVDAVAVLRESLAALGDSLVVVGGEGLWNVHVHVDDVGAAIEAGIAAGRPHRIRVTHFADQVSAARQRPSTRSGRRVVAVAAGAGLGDLFVEAGATVVPGGPGRRPSTGQIVEAVTSAGAAEVIVLPNDRDSIAAAEAAARTVREAGDVRVAVIRTDAQVQGLAALAVHEPGRTFEEDIVEMSAAARHARAGSVTVASRQAMTTAGPCEPGDVLGMIEGDFVLVGDDLFAVATHVLERLLGGGGELVTVVAGSDSGDLAQRCASYLNDAHPTVDVLVYDGGQAGYPLLVGVE